MFFLQNPAYKHKCRQKHNPEKTEPNWKYNALRTEDSGATYDARVTRRGAGKHLVEWLTLGRVPLLWCQHLFARPRGADPIFTGCQLVCFEMIGINLLSFEATYL